MKLHTTVKESGEDMLKVWPDVSEESQIIFEKHTLKAVRHILHNTTEVCKTTSDPSKGTKAVVENFVAAAYDAYYACGRGPRKEWRVGGWVNQLFEQGSQRPDVQWDPRSLEAESGGHNLLQKGQPRQKPSATAWTLPLPRGPSYRLKAARNDFAVQLFLALRVLDVEAKGYHQYLLPEPFLHQVQTPSW
eukprot:SM000015S01276  [mRNA]  locus=s15:917049:918128:- [translate_table: standard]